jgi:hypothetical protein
MRRASLALLVVLLAAAPAHASQVAGSGESVGVQVTAVEVNDVLLRRAEDGRLEVTDSAPVEAWSGCESIDAHTVRCAMPTDQISVSLGAGDGADQSDTAANTLRVGPGVTVRVYAIGAAGPDTFYGGAGADNFWTREGDDRLAGGGGADRLGADSGNDILAGDGASWAPMTDGEPGGDHVDGGPGDDELEGGGEYDVMSGDSGRDRVSYADHPTGVRLRGDLFWGDLPGPWSDQLGKIEVIVGSPYADVIQGNDTADEIHGGGGDDRITGAGGADLVDGGDGDDRLFGDTVDPENPGDPSQSGRADDLRGGAGNDLLRGDTGRDTLAAGAGDDTVDAREETSNLDARDELVSCGDGFDRGQFDWNDEGPDCEEIVARDKPPMPRPPDPPKGTPPPERGPGPQPALGSPVAADGIVRVPVHCAAATRCSARVRVREVRSVRVGRRLRSRPGRMLVSRTVLVPAGKSVVAELPLPASARARVRSAGRGRASVELRLGARRWTRPLTLTRAKVARR